MPLNKLKFKLSKVRVSYDDPWSWDAYTGSFAGEYKVFQEVEELHKNDVIILKENQQKYVVLEVHWYSTGARVLIKPITDNGVGNTEYLITGQRYKLVTNLLSL